MGPEYSGLWRVDSWQIEGRGTRFYWYLPSLLATMRAGQTIELPAAAWGEWSAEGGETDWSNAVRRAISTHFTPLADRATGQRPVAKAVYQGLGALPSYQTEDVLYQTIRNAGQLGLEQWTWDAGTVRLLLPLLSLSFAPHSRPPRLSSSALVAVHLVPPVFSVQRQHGGAGQVLRCPGRLVPRAGEHPDPRRLPPDLYKMLPQDDVNYKLLPLG